MTQYISVLIAVFLWGIHGPAGRYLALEGISMPFVTVVRFWIGTACLGFYLFVSGRFARKYASFYKELIPIGLVGIALNSIVYHLGFNYISATAVMLLENLAPFFVLLLVRFVDQERVGPAKLLSALVSFSGLIFVMLGKGGVETSGTQYLWGIFLELLAGVTFGFYTWMSGKFLQRHERELADTGLSRSDVIINLLFYVFLIASVAMSPLLFVKWNYPTRWPHLFWIAEMGIFQSGVAYILWNRAIAQLKSGVAAIFFFLTVFFTIINEMLFLHFVPNRDIVTGCVLIVGGVLVLMASDICKRRS